MTKIVPVIVIKTEVQSSPKSFSNLINHSPRSYLKIFSIRIVITLSVNYTQKLNAF